MKVVVVAWLSGPGTDIEPDVPLAFAGRRNRRLGFSNAIELVFLEGLARLDPARAAELRDLGYTLVDASAPFERHAARIPALRRFGEFENRCFLRWPVLAELYGGQPLLHLDGDVVCNEDPAVLSRLFAGRNLVLQGCPALTAIAGAEWFQRYEAELAAFAADVEGYSARAWAEREGWQRSAVERWAGSRDRRIISSDQDLLSHLIHTGRIPQSDPRSLAEAATGHVFFENPLIVGDLVPERPLGYRRAEGIDYLGDRRVGVWHMQTDWCRHLAKHMIREALRIGRHSPLPWGERDWTALVSRAARRAGGGRALRRDAIYRRFFEEGDFSAVFDGARWWQPGVFPLAANSGPR